jgi:hypothetical protein
VQVLRRPGVPASSWACAGALMRGGALVCIAGSLPGSTIPEGYMDVQYEGKVRRLRLPGFIASSTPPPLPPVEPRSVRPETC